MERVYLDSGVYRGNDLSTTLQQRVLLTTCTKLELSIYICRRGRDWLLTFQESRDYVVDVELLEFRHGAGVLFSLRARLYTAVGHS